MGVDDLVDVVNVYGKRSLRIVTRLVDMHLEIAQRELLREQQRIIHASILLALGATLLTSGVILIQALGMVWFYQSRLHWVRWCIGLIGSDVLVGSVLLGLALRSLQGPYMQETLAQITKTTLMLIQDEYEH